MPLFKGIIHERKAYIYSRLHYSICVHLTRKIQLLFVLPFFMNVFFKSHYLYIVEKSGITPFYLPAPHENGNFCPFSLLQSKGIEQFATLFLFEILYGIAIIYCKK